MNRKQEKSQRLQDTQLSYRNNKLTVGGIFCGLEKVYDSINHDTLSSKYKIYGFGGKTNALLRSYLSDRHQRVLINNSSLIILLFQNRTK